VASEQGADLEAAIVALTERLSLRFSGQVDPEVVETTVRRHAAGFADARISDFVPVLIERQSVQELTEWLSTKEQLPE
jgi:hypothetical protein